jgi:hypothetical protein
MKQTAKWIVGLGMLVFCLQIKPCPHGNCPAGRCLADGPKPMGWQQLPVENPEEVLVQDSLSSSFSDSLSRSQEEE